jgi:hypothetical protein
MQLRHGKFQKVRRRSWGLTTGAGWRDGAYRGDTFEHEAAHARSSYALHDPVELRRPERFMLGRMASSIRSRLLYTRSARVERLSRDVEQAKLGEELSLVQTRACAIPEERAELEHSISWPQRHEADQAAQILLWLQPVQACRGNDRVQRSCALGVIVAAAEQPRLATSATVFRARSAPLLVNTSRPSSKKRVSTSR